MVGEPPIDALAAKVTEVDAREAIILTRPHVVAEFFHVDWTSRARRKIGVPVLHLLEHENFDEAEGYGGGALGSLGGGPFLVARFFGAPFRPGFGSYPRLGLP